MSYSEVVHENQAGWLCNNDLLLVCERDELEQRPHCSLTDETPIPMRTRTRRRHVPQLDFTDRTLFPRCSRVPVDDELVSELSSLLACREYVRTSNEYFDRQHPRSSSIGRKKDTSTKIDDVHQRHDEQNRAERQQRRRQHPSYVSRFDQQRCSTDVTRTKRTTSIRRETTVDR
jgi:hypothetical protein